MTQRPTSSCRDRRTNALGVQPTHALLLRLRPNPRYRTPTLLFLRTKLLPQPKLLRASTLLPLTANVSHSRFLPSLLLLLLLFLSTLWPTFPLLTTIHDSPLLSFSPSLLRPYLLSRLSRALYRTGLLRLCRYAWQIPMLVSALPPSESSLVSIRPVFLSDPSSCRLTFLSLSYETEQMCQYDSVSYESLPGSSEGCPRRAAPLCSDTADVDPTPVSVPTADAPRVSGTVTTCESK
jgi:hypothetical protein